MALFVLLWDLTRFSTLKILEEHKIGGRPKLMSDDKIRTAKAMLKDNENYPFISDIIKTLDIGRTTFYRYFPPESIQPQQ